MEEFRIANGQGILRPNKSSENVTSLVSEQFYSTVSVLPDVQLKHTLSIDEKSSCSEEDSDAGNDSPLIYRTDALQIAQFYGSSDIKITTKVNNRFKNFHNDQKTQFT